MFLYNRYIVLLVYLLKDHLIFYFLLISLYFIITKENLHANTAVLV